MKDIFFPKPTLPTLSKLLFFLVIFFLPQQFGPHFWPYFSFVKGIRVDYLSPTLYISDILITLLFLTSFRKVFTDKNVLSFLGSKLTYTFFIFLVIPLLYAHSFPAFLFGVLKIIEFLYLGLYCMSQLQKKDVTIIIEVFTLSALIQSCITIAQFINQGSLNGLFYFLGERYYTLSGIGVATMNTPQGLMVRPYGTFSHPNVLAFYLFTSSVFLSYYVSRTVNLKFKLFSIISFVIIQLALFLTFSRTVLICDILFLTYIGFTLFIKRKRVRRELIMTGIILIILFALYLTAFNIRFLNFSNILNDYALRQDLSLIGIAAIREYPLGLGINNFYYYESLKQLNFSATYLQPIHNIFLLLASTTGVICTLLFAYFLGVTFLSLKRAVKRVEGFIFFKALFILFLSIIFVGMFDHFFLTIQQGQLLLVLILGLCWNRKLNN